MWPVAFARKFHFLGLLLIAGLALFFLFFYLYSQQQQEPPWKSGPQRVQPIPAARQNVRIGQNWRMAITSRQQNSAQKQADDILPRSNVVQSTTKQQRTPYPPRLNMGPCPPLFGKVTVLVIVVESSYKTHYAVAQRSLECYLRSTNYTFKLVDLDHDERVNRHCKHDQLFFKKQCAVSVYLPDSDWTLVLDADAGVVNPNHCIEEWIDDRVDLVFYERFFNWEVASGNYLAKNTEFARAFIMDWANMQFTQPKNFSGADNGALQLHILQTVIPGARAEAKACRKIWQLSDSYERYMGYVTCVKTALGATRIWPGKLRILRRAHAWVRDWFLTSDAWAERDFMLHGWKAQNLSGPWKSPFTRVPNPNACIGGYAGWEWRNELRVSVDEIRRQLAQTEHSSGMGYPQQARALPYLSEPDVGECYPQCDEWT